MPSPSEDKTTMGRCSGAARACPVLVRTRRQRADAAVGQRRSGCPVWQNWIFDFRLVAGQRLEKRDDLIDFRVIQLRADLSGTHDRDRLAEIPDFAGMEIGGGKRDVPQRR